MKKVAFSAAGARRGAAAAALVVSTVLLAACLGVRASPRSDEHRVGYTIEARYDAETGSIHARERVSWKNTTSSPTQELWFRLYLNAFAHRRTTWMLEGLTRTSPPSGRSLSEAGSFGGIEVTRVSGPGGEDWSARLSTTAPDDGNVEDRTVARLALPEAVAPGGAITVELEFKSRLPAIRARTGRAGDFIAAAQWFPKLGVFEPPRETPSAPARWNCPQFHRLTEFYADYGRYSVTLNLPEQYRGKVAATGVRINETPRDDTERYSVTYEAREVHDFAWFADPDFVVVGRRFRGGQHRDPLEEARWLALLGPEATGAEMLLRDVTLEVYLQPEHQHLAERHLRAMEVGLVWFGRAFGAYPYPVLRAVDPQHDARRAGGMEYPMVITAGARLLTPSGRLNPEAVTVHEVGHQWFYGIVANDEFENPFLDEGFNTFAESTALLWGFGEDRLVSSFSPWQYRAVPLIEPDAAPGPLGLVGAAGNGTLHGLGTGRPARYLVDLPPLTYYGESIGFPWLERRQWKPVAGLDVVWRRGWSYGERETYRMHTYRLAALTLEAYRRVAGERAVFRALRRYARQHWLAHARPEDFIHAASAVSREMKQRGERDPSALPIGLDAAHYFEQVWRVAGYADYAVDPVHCSEGPSLEKEPGDDGGSHPTRVPQQVCRIVVRQLGRWQLPVEIELTFEDGSRELVVWNGEGWWTAIEGRYPSRLVAVRVDPRRRWVFERDLSNNQWSAAPDRESTVRVMVGLFHQLVQRLWALGRIG
ncbi:MAG: M1 family metallopeptidase [Acidobacteriota bacterium]|nr:MAG: M1 family metallopeptidase [Acidobacteriota bacterium]